MWQPHQFIRHLAEPQLKVSAFIYILILMGVDDAMVAKGNHCLLKGLVSLTEKEKKREKRQMTDFN